MALDRAKYEAARELAALAAVAARRAKTPEQRAAFSLLEIELVRLAPAPTPTPEEVPA